MRSLALVALLCGMVGTGIVACGDDEDTGGSTAGSGGKGGAGGSGNAGKGGAGSGDAGAATTGGESSGGSNSNGGESSNGGVGPGTGGADGDAGSSAGGTDGDAGGNAGGAPGACNNVVADGAVVSETAGEGALPTPQGGALEEGTYVLTAWEVYAPEDPELTTRTITLVVTGDELHVAGAQGQQFNATFSTAGSSMTLVPVCPVVGNPDTFGYTFDNDEFWIIREDQSRVEVFTKQ